MQFLRRIAVLLAVCASASAVELHVQFGALERMLSEQAFTQEGRRYVRGNKSNKCNFAYLESPRVQGDHGLLRIRAKFSGRTSLNMLGQCVGLGDAFNLVILVRPQYRDGYLRLVEVKAASDDRTGFYIRRVCSALESSLTRDFKYPLEPEARKILEEAGAQPGYRREVRNFIVTDIRVDSDSLVLGIDFQLTLK